MAKVETASRSHARRRRGGQRSASGMQQCGAMTKLYERDIEMLLVVGKMERGVAAQVAERNERVGAVSSGAVCMPSWVEVEGSSPSL